MDEQQHGAEFAEAVSAVKHEIKAWRDFVVMRGDPELQRHSDRLLHALSRFQALVNAEHDRGQRAVWAAVLRLMHVTPDTAAEDLQS